MRTLLPILLLLASIGCQNPCQQICHDMARFAEDECGIVVPAAQVQTCLNEQATADRDTKGACRTGNSVADIDRTWDCDDVEDFFPSE